jgi:hypothetical protein
MAAQGERMGSSLERDIGGIDARVTMLERRVAVIEREIKEELRALNKKIDGLGDDILASRSSWKAIVWFVGLVATASTVVTALYQLGVIR